MQGKKELIVIDTLISDSVLPSLFYFNMLVANGKGSFVGKETKFYLFIQIVQVNQNIIHFIDDTRKLLCIHIKAYNNSVSRIVNVKILMKLT